MIGLEELRERVVGRALPGGTYRAEGYEGWLGADAMLAPPTGDELHPIFIFHAAVRGVGYSIGELFELLDCPMADGPMLGEMDIIQSRALRAGEAFEVSPTITAVERKRGRSGTFDLVTAEVRIVDAAGDDAATLRNTYVCPRREGR
ncbi:hypothetical protein [Euzebya sp.]|uniref:hypothetical protein n=1 Tax=Euzebya sp. TaxID=1971409 RepID=UPI003510F926